MPLDDQALDEQFALEELAELAFDTVDAAAIALSDNELAAYREARDSVVTARRRAETTEGRLRIN